MRFTKLYLSVLILCLFSGTIAKSQFVWTPQSSGLSLEAIKDVAFQDVNNGWAVGQNGKILRTENGGSTWLQLSSPTTQTLHSISFSSNTTGWIVGDNETLLKSTDGGLSWFIAPPPSGSSSHLYRIQFVDTNNGWIIGVWDNFRTTDGGNSWTIFTPTGSGGSVNDMHFLNPSEGWICGQAGYLAHTIDGGVNWTQVTTLFASDIYTVYAFSLDNVMIGGSGGYIHRSFDTGGSWSVTNSPATTAILDIDFLTADVGVAVGNSGTILSTQDGYNWVSNSVTSLDMNAVDMVANGQGWVVGYSGAIYKSSFGDNDIEIEAYFGLDTICASVPTSVIISVKNLGPSPIEDFDIAVTDGATVLAYQHWSGFLPAGSYTDVNMGWVGVDVSGYYTGVLSGDSITANNISSKYIEVVPNPAEVSPTQIICEGDSVEIQASGGTQYQWMNATVDSLNPVQIVKPEFSTYFYVQIKTDYCFPFDSVYVIVNPCTEDITAFSPNGDGVNDAFIVDDLNGTDNSLKIFNRWGDLVNSYTNYDNVTVFWDGTDFNGVNLLEGTYFYVFETSDFSITKSNWVQIVR